MALLSNFIAVSSSSFLFSLIDFLLLLLLFAGAADIPAKCTSRTSGALLAFQLLMGYGFKANMELLTTELPKDQDGLAIDLSPFSLSARKCARQLLDLVEANRSAAGGSAPSLSTQTQAP
jgi:hypothetical protein